jgi:hypothetical protein
VTVALLLSGHVAALHVPKLLNNAQAQVMRKPCCGCAKKNDALRRCHWGTLLHCMCPRSLTMLKPEGHAHLAAAARKKKLK